MEPKYWIGTVSKDHVVRGHEGGFAQVGHGKGEPLRRMKAGDWLIYYSPRTSLHGGDPLQAFTAIGQIADDNTYQAEMGPDFHPWRRDVRYLDATEASIRPLLDDLSFTAGRPNWGFAFRRGHFEITEGDFWLIAEALGIESQHLPARENWADHLPPFS